MYISKEQLKLLNRISEKTEIRNTKDNPDIDYLEENGLVYCCVQETNSEYYLQAKITEPGKAFLYEATHNRKRATASLVLSLIAAALSLMNTFTPFPDWIRAFIAGIK